MSGSTHSYKETVRRLSVNAGETAAEHLFQKDNRGHIVGQLPAGIGTHQVKGRLKAGGLPAGFSHNPGQVPLHVHTLDLNFPPIAAEFPRPNFSQVFGPAESHDPGAAFHLRSDPKLRMQHGLQQISALLVHQKSNKHILLLGQH